MAFDYRGAGDVRRRAFFGPDHHLARVQRVFRAANHEHIAIVVHVHANIDHHRPNGAKEALTFLEQLLPEAPDVAEQIAHLSGGGGYDDATDAALPVFVNAIKRKDPRMKNVYFDVCGIAIPGMWEDKPNLLVNPHSPDRNRPASLWRRCRNTGQSAEGCRRTPFSKLAWGLFPNPCRYSRWC